MYMLELVANLTNKKLIKLIYLVFGNENKSLKEGMMQIKDVVHEVWEWSKEHVEPEQLYDKY